MDESESKNEKPKEGRRFDPELLKEGLRCDRWQYKFLKECSEKGKVGIKKWNKRRKEHSGEDIFLEGADFNKKCLKEADFDKAHLEKAIFFRAHLEGSRFQHAKARGTSFNKAHLENAKLSVAHFEDCNFAHAFLENADLTSSFLIGANFNKAKMRGCWVRCSVVDGATRFWKCQINKYSRNERFTDFSGTALANVIIDSGRKQLLEYNIRRMNWEKWYKEQHWLLRWLVRKFWEISDYGISTKQIIKTFFKLAFVFAIIYYIWGFIDYYLVGIKDYPGIVSDLFVLEDNKEVVSCWLVPFRTVYFSIVTMTTLGFGDMYANAHNFLRGLFGHALLALQVILGYVLLGALVTRFAVLFTAGGPAGKFSNEQKKKGQGE